MREGYRPQGRVADRSVVDVPGSLFTQRVRILDAQLHHEIMRMLCWEWSWGSLGCCWCCPWSTSVGFWSWPSAAAEPASKLAVTVKARNPSKERDIVFFPSRHTLPACPVSGRS